MNYRLFRSNSDSNSNRPMRFRFNLLSLGIPGLILIAVVVIGGPFVIYNWCRIYVPPKHIAVVTRKTGTDMENGQEFASAGSKGVQLDVLTEGRYFRNPYTWDWSVYPMVEIPEGKLGVRIRLFGDDLPYGEIIANNDNQKGIVKEVLTAGRYKINAMVREVAVNGKKKTIDADRKWDCAEIIEIHDPVTILAGFKGVVTNLTGKLPDDPNSLLVAEGFRGVQSQTLDEGTHYVNPYILRVEMIDTRSQRFNLAEGGDMGFPSKDGFWVSLDGRIEFRVKPEDAALVYVLYNERNNDRGQGRDISQEIIRKVIMPNARSFCRLEGSNSSGRDFIGGETRSAFQDSFERAIRETCDKQGIEIVQALITKIKPPEAIAGPVRDREVSRQSLTQYEKQKLQQDQEANLARELALVEQKKRLVDADREVIKLITESKQRQDVQLAEANRDKEVAQLELDAAKDKAEAILAQKTAEAAVIRFENEADAAGWKNSVLAFSGDGQAYARYVLYQKLAPGFRSIMTNTANSPLMDVFNNFAAKPKANETRSLSESTPIAKTDE